MYSRHLAVAHLIVLTSKLYENGMTLEWFKNLLRLHYRYYGRDTR